MEERNNIFTVDTAITEGSYIKVTGEYLIPDCLPFESGDILTEDKYNGHQIYVSFATKDNDGKDGLILDTRSMHPSIKKYLDKVSSGLHLLKMEKTINYWGLAHEYAESKYKMEKGDDISKYERYEEVKEAYEAGFLKAMELLKTEN